MKSIVNNSHSVFEDNYSKSSWFNLRNQILPHGMNDTTPQNERRLEALLDVLNHVSMSAGIGAVMLNADGSFVDSNQIFNTDKTCLKLETDSRGRIYLKSML